MNGKRENQNQIMTWKKTSRDAKGKWEIKMNQNIKKSATKQQKYQGVNQTHMSKIQVSELGKTLWTLFQKSLHTTVKKKRRKRTNRRSTNIKEARKSPFCYDF